jgi:hypothetical protein
MTIPKDGAYHPDIATKFANIEKQHEGEPHIPTKEEVATVMNAPEPEVEVDQNDPVAMTKLLCSKLYPDGKDLLLHQWVYQCFHNAYQAGHHAAAGVIPMRDDPSIDKPIGYMHPEHGFYASDDTMMMATQKAYEAGKLAATTSTLGVSEWRQPYPWKERLLEGVTLISALVAVGYYLTHYGYLVHN